ncbi:MAG: hypothetical protein KGH91_07380 [Rhodospirillales bacterium]|nr:hypothetical protein [Rhodospirillales bacterium]
MNSFTSLHLRTAHRPHLHHLEAEKITLDHFEEEVRGIARNADVVVVTHHGRVFTLLANGRPIR